MRSDGLCQPENSPKMALTPREAARALGISERTLFEYTRAGKIRCTKLSPQTKRYLPADLDAFLRAGRVG